MPHDDVKAALASRPLFAALTDATIGRLAAAARRQRLAKGQSLFEQGDPSDAVYVVMAGQVAVGTVGAEGEETHFADLTAGAVFGEMAVIDGGPRTAGITAVSATEVLRLPGAVFIDALSTEPAFALSVLQDVIGKLRAADIRLEDRSVLSFDRRLAKFLDEMATADTIELTQAQIAERLGVSRESVNRRLKALEDIGAVALGRGRVIVKDRALL